MTEQERREKIELQAWKSGHLSECEDCGTIFNVSTRYAVDDFDESGESHNLCDDCYGSYLVQYGIDLAGRDPD